MKEETKRKIAAYFIIFIMIFSAAGFALYFATPTKENKTTTQEIQSPNVIPLKFEADINAKVKKFINKYMLIGYTNNYDITAIDQNIMLIKGVSSVDSKFVINKETHISANYTYIATIYGNPNKTELLNNVKNILIQPQIYPFAELDIKKLHLYNKDLNIYKDYELGQPVYVLVAPNTEINDLIEAKLYATFSNDVLTNIIGEEIKNISAMPILKDENTVSKFNFENYTIKFEGKDINKISLNTTDYGNSKIYITKDLNLEEIKNAIKDLNVSYKIFIVGFLDINAPNPVQIYFPYNENIDFNNLPVTLHKVFVRNKLVQINATYRGDKNTSN